MFRWTGFSALVAVLLIALGGSTCSRWQRADEFINGLRCGMSEAEIVQYASSFQGAEPARPESTNLPPLVINHDSTRIRCWFENGGLRWVQVAWISSPMKLTEAPRIDLCSPERR